MKTSLVVLGTLVACATGAFATDYYVDAQYGNDAWDGTRPIESASGTSGPRKTLVQAMALAGVGDTVYAAEGTYNQGSETYGDYSCPSRVVILRGRRLVATGRRELTIIRGKGSDAKATACGAGAVRCVFMEGKDSSAPGAVIKGFTITGGYTLAGAEGYDTSGGGVCGSVWSSYDNDGLVVDCDIYNNASGYRGPNVAWSTLLRCRVGNASGGSFDCYKGTVMIDSLYCGDQNIYWSVKMYNCTHTSAQSIWGNGNNFFTYNCLFTNPNYGISNSGHRSDFSRTYFRVSEKPDPQYTIYHDGCRFDLTAEDLKMSALDPARPLAGSVVEGQGNLSYYYAATNNWKDANVAWQREFNLTDLNGNPRIVDGKIDVGCCQSGLTDIYADAENGDDANDGTSAEKAVKTLTKAMALSRPGDTIYAAEGDYDEGGDVAPGTSSNRVTVLPGRRLMASGRRSATRILGKIAEGASYGCATNAMRCVYFPDAVGGLPGGIVKGFTLANGRTWPGGDDRYGNGGGAMGAGLVADCVFEGCGSRNRGPNVAYNTTLFRCRIGVASSPETLDCYAGCKVVGCLFLNNMRIYMYTSLYNCTLAGDAQSPYSNTGIYNCYNCLYASSAAGAGTSMNYKNTFALKSWPATDPRDAKKDATCRFGLSASALRTLASGRPLEGSVALGAGDMSLYLTATNGWHAAWEAEFDLNDLDGKPRTDGKISVGCYEYAALYVNDETGDDENDGLSPASAKKTITGAINSRTEPLPVKVAAGVYDEVEVEAPDGQLSRVVVPADWYIEGAGRGKTIIKGKISSGNLGLGDDAVRCAYIDAGGILCGVTLQDGRTATTGVAGGVYLKGALVDSEITGCIGGTGQGSDRRASAAYGVGDGALIRCYVHDNNKGLDIHQGALIGCVYDSNYYGEGLQLNSNFVNTWVKGWPTEPSRPIYNCLLNVSPDRGVMCYNCVICGPFKYSTTSSGGVDYINNGYDEKTCIVNAEQPDLDAKFRPLKGSILADAGSRALYDEKFPAKWVMFKDRDVSGGARILNEEIDIGAGEYNWGPEVNGRIEVVEADDAVSLDGRTIGLADGGALALAWTSRRERDGSFAVTVPAGGTLLVKVNGEIVTPVNGTCNVTLLAGENLLELAYSGTGTATVGGFFTGGTLLLLR